MEKGKMIDLDNRISCLQDEILDLEFEILNLEHKLHSKYAALGRLIKESDDLWKID